MNLLLKNTHYVNVIYEVQNIKMLLYFFNEKYNLLAN